MTNKEKVLKVHPTAFAYRTYYSRTWTIYRQSKRGMEQPIRIAGFNGFPSARAAWKEAARRLKK